MMKLDPKGLEAAREQPGTNHEAIIRAYIDAITPAEAGGLVERLRAITSRMTQDYDSRDEIMDEAATALEAQAAELSSLRMIADSQVVSHRDFNTVRAEKSESDLASERAAHEQTKRERDELAKYFADSCSILERLASTAAAVENSLVEVEKALEPFADIAGEPWADENGWTEAACRNDRICDWFGPSAFYTARRALTGGRDD